MTTCTRLQDKLFIQPQINWFYKLQPDLIRKIFQNVYLQEFSKLQTVDKRFNRIIISLLPYVSFKIVHLMASCYLLPFVIKTSNTLLKQNIESIKKIQTSCIQSLLAISVIFSGSNQVKNISTHLYENYKFCFEIGVVIGNKREQLQLTIDNLFTGIMLLKASPLEAIQKSAKPFTSHIDAFLDKCYEASQDNFDLCKEAIHESLKICKYDFNAEPLNLLKREINKNSKLVNCKNSFIYYIAILMPKPEELKIPFCYIFYHSFTIEQYYSSIKQKCRYRLYQSNMDKMTLAEYFTKMKYESFSDKGTFNKTKLNNFFIDLRLVLSGVYNENLHKRCFHSMLVEFQPLKYDQKTQTLGGLSLRYKSEAFNPGHCLRNFFNFI